MTPNRSSSNDRNLLLAVSAFVVAGAAGIALLAGLAAQREQSRSVTASVDESPSRVVGVTGPRPTPLPAMPAVASLEPDAGPATPEPAGTELAFLIDPDADPWREGQRAYRSGELETAHLYFEADTAARPERAYSHYMLGLAAWKTGRLEQAVAAMERSAELNPASIRTFINLSRIHNDRGDPDRALTEAERALEIDPENAVALYQRARSLFNAERPAEALETLDRVVAIDAGSGQAHNLIGLIHLRAGRDGAALFAMREAARLVPELAYVQNNLGLALERNAQPAEAVRAFRLAKSLDESHAGAPISLARVESLLPTGAASATPVEGIAAVDSVPSSTAVTVAGERPEDPESSTVFDEGKQTPAGEPVEVAELPRVE